MSAWAACEWRGPSVGRILTRVVRYTEDGRFIFYVHDHRDHLEKDKKGEILASGSDDTLEGAQEKCDVELARIAAPICEARR